MSCHTELAPQTSVVLVTGKGEVSLPMQKGDSRNVDISTVTLDRGEGEALRI